MSEDATVSTPAAVPHPGDTQDAEYAAFLGRVNARLAANLDPPGGPAGDRPRLFTTDASGLFEAYLAALPEADRQHYNCRACQGFIERFGGLVTVAAGGRTDAAFWDEADAPAYFRPAVAAVAKLVRRAAVTGVFLTGEAVWGKPVTGVWRHLSATPPGDAVSPGGLKTPGQEAAEKAEDYRAVRRALGEFPAPVVDRAVALLEADALYRPEKVAGPARWLRDLHAAVAAADGRSGRDNVVWRAVAAAPPGFCHPRTSVVGTLLEDLAAGLDWDDVRRRFAAKMHPLQYQRPQAAPTAGNLAAAEKLVADLGVAASLRRRFARLDEVDAVWRPAPAPERPAAGVFGHLTPKGGGPAPSAAAVPVGPMTWEKFARTVLPSARSVAFHVPPSGSFTGILTAEDPDAPPVLQWDRPDRRNPFSSYVYVPWSPASRWGLRGGEWSPVAAVTLFPPHWYGQSYPHHAEGVVLVLPGAKDPDVRGNALFPETLRADLRPARAAVEAYAASARLGGAAEASACGYSLAKGGTWSARVRVVADTGLTAEYTLDRWD